MLKLNLVSNEARKEIRLRHLHDMTKRIIFIFFIFAIFISVVFVIVEFTLASYFNLIITDGQKVIKENFKEDLALINQKIDAVDQIQRDYVEFSPLLEHVLSHVGRGINIAAVKIDAKERKLQISGLADTRENFSNFQTDFKNSEVFLEVKSPPVNIFKKEDISFNLEAVF